MFLPVLVACEKTIDYDIPQEPSKFSVDARIMTGDRFQVFVSHTEYSLSAKPPQVVSDASVILFENEVQVAQLQWISNAPDNGYYMTPIRPSAGKNYRVEVFNEKYGLASGEALSLSPTQITAWNIDTTRLEISMSFKDVESSEDYYAVRVIANQGGNEYPMFLGTTDPTVEFFYDYGEDIFGDNVKFGYVAYLTDETFEGRNKTVLFDELYYSDFGGVLPDEIILEVSKISKDYYLHEQSKGAQYVSGDNPFAEPVQLYSNIDNGYGIVAAGAPARERIKL